MEIKVSIIIPVYNVSAYIERCVRSVMRQTYSHIECILVDDATQDDSIGQCKQMIAVYQGPIQFLILSHQQNRGLSAARNTATDAATGDYVFYLDSDDEITPDCIETLVRPVEKDATVEMVIGNYVRDVHGHQISRKQAEKDIETNEAIRDYYFCQRGFYVNAWNKLVKKDFLERHQIRFREGLLFEDNLWTFFLLKHLCHCYILSNVTYLHHWQSRSITASTNREKKSHHWQLVYEEIAKNFTAGESGKEARFYIKYLCFQLIRNHQEQNLHHFARSYLKALQDDHYILELVFYKMIVSLSKFGMGRVFLRYIVETIKA